MCVAAGLRECTAARGEDARAWPARGSRCCAQPTLKILCPVAGCSDVPSSRPSTGRPRTPPSSESHQQNTTIAHAWNTIRNSTLQCKASTTSPAFHSDILRLIGLWSVQWPQDFPDKTRTRGQSDAVPVLSSPLWSPLSDSWRWSLCWGRYTRCCAPCSLQQLRSWFY